jgi:hypothetical protein
VQAASVLGQRFAGSALAYLLDRLDYVPERTRPFNIGLGNGGFR